MRRKSDKEKERREGERIEMSWKKERREEERIEMSCQMILPLSLVN